MKTIFEKIKSIQVEKSNFEHIAKTGNINGTLLSEITRIINEDRAEQLRLNGVAVSLPSDMMKLSEVYTDDCDDVDGYYVAGRFKEVWVYKTDFDKNKCINN